MSKQRFEYQVVEIYDTFHGQNLDSRKGVLEGVLNHHAQEGWGLSHIHTPTVKANGITGALIVMERPV